MVQQVDDPGRAAAASGRILVGMILPGHPNVAAAVGLGAREGALSAAVAWGSLGLRFGTRLPVDRQTTPGLDRRVG